MNILRVLAALAFVATVAMAPAGPINKNCPIKGTPVKDGGPSSDYMGKTIGFCWNNCKGQFDSAPAKFAANIPELKAAAKPSDKPAKPLPTGACDCKKMAKGYYCVTDKRELSMDDVRNGLCKRCEGKPLQIEYCLKLVPKVLSKQQIKDGMAPYDEDKARISYLCEGCGVKAEFEPDFKHKEGCKPPTSGFSGGGLKKVCAKSGKFPHATDDK